LSNDVTISRDTTVTVDSDNQHCRDLTIQSSSGGGSIEGVLAIAAGGGDLSVHGLLTMADPSGGGDPCRIEFTASGAKGELKFLIDAEVHRAIVVGGPGKIEIAEDVLVTLKNNGLITGASGNQAELEIAGLGEIENDAAIEVSEGFNLKFSGAGLGTGSSGSITIDHANGSVQFATSAPDEVTNSEADVNLLKGTLDFDSPLEFHGGFSMQRDGKVNTEGLDTDEMAVFCGDGCP